MATAQPLYSMFPSIPEEIINDTFTELKNDMDATLNHLLALSTSMRENGEAAAPTKKQPKAKKHKKSKKQPTKKQPPKTNQSAYHEQATLKKYVVLDIPSSRRRQLALLQEIAPKHNIFHELSIEDGTISVTFEAKPEDEENVLQSDNYALVVPESLKHEEFMVFDEEGEMTELGKHNTVFSAVNKLIRIFANEIRLDVFPQFVSEDEQQEGQFDLSLTVSQELNSSMELDNALEDGFVDVNSPFLMDYDKNPADIDEDKCFLPPAEEVAAVGILNHMQSTALRKVVNLSKTASDAAYNRVLSKFKTQGFTEKDLKLTLRYIRDEAPIIIHFPDEVLGKFIDDTEYRNQFETKTSKGSLNKQCRINWENNIFKKVYDKAKPNERVKYGVLNIVNDPNGVACCSSYGVSYLLMKKVRLRTTFASCDTSNAAVQIASCEYYNHVLETYNPAELKAVVQVATKQKLTAPSNCISTYKEIQIHGPLFFSEHVEAIVPNKMHKTNKSLVSKFQKFAKKNGCLLLWPDEYEEHVRAKELYKKSLKDPISFKKN